MDENFIRNIFYYKSYYLDFFNTLKPEVRKKFNWTLKLIATIDRLNFSNIWKEHQDFMKLGLKLGLIFTEFLAFLTKANW